MHLTRSQATKKLPIARKGTKYIAKAKIDPKNSVPVVIALRDMLKLARTAKEVQKMIHLKLLKINGKEVKDFRDSIRLFNILEADKSYKLTLSPIGKFTFEEDSSKERLCKVVNKTLFRKNQLQYNLHEGTNLISKEKININDTLYLDFSGKIKKHAAFEKGKKCFVTSGKYSGQKGLIEEIDGRKAKIKLGHKDISVVLEKRSVFVI